jgi:hypothetical protein
MDNTLTQAINDIQQGNKEKGKKSLVSYIKQNPNNESAWGWLFNASDTNSEKLYCLQQIVRINPRNEKAKTLIRKYSTNLDPLDFAEVNSNSPDVSKETKNCPYCAERIYSSAIVCPHCNRDLRIAPSLSPSTMETPLKKREKKWYMETWVKIVTFIFFTPLWTLIVLEDPDSSIGVKIVAGVLLVIYLIIICPAIFNAFY